MIEVTDWAADILGRSQEAARRLNPDARVRLARASGGIEPQLTDQPDPQDGSVDVGEMVLYVEAGLEGLVDVQEPHDQLVLRPAGSVPNDRSGH